MSNFADISKKIDIVASVDKETYHDTELLLKLHRKVLFRVNRRLEQVQDECKLNDRKELADYIGSIIEFDSKKKKQHIYDHLISMGTSLCLLELMETALAIMKDYPDDGELYYRILRYAYFDTVRSTHEEIAEYCNLARTTYYRKRAAAVQTYAAMLWGYVIPELDYLLPKLPSEKPLLLAE